MLQLQGASPLTPHPLLGVVILDIGRMKSLEIAHRTSRNSENASASGGKPPDPLPLLGVVIKNKVVKYETQVCVIVSSHI